MPLYSRRGFCSHGAALGTPVLHYNRCATPAKLPFCKCPVQLLYVGSKKNTKKKNFVFFLSICKAHWMLLELAHRAFIAFEQKKNLKNKWIFFSFSFCVKQSHLIKSEQQMLSST